MERNTEKGRCDITKTTFAPLCKLFFCIRSTFNTYNTSHNYITPIIYQSVLYEYVYFSKLCMKTRQLSHIQNKLFVPSGEM